MSSFGKAMPKRDSFVTFPFPLVKLSFALQSTAFPAVLTCRLRDNDRTRAALQLRFVWMAALAPSFLTGSPATPLNGTAQNCAAADTFTSGWL